MHEGLPHPFHEDEEFVHKLWTTSNYPIHGYRFYKKPADPSAAVERTLLEILTKKESFRGYRGPKMCGGYHADFAVRLESAGKSTLFLVCLGCGEVLIYSEDKDLICELNPEAEESLEHAWKDHQGVPFVPVGSRLPLGVDALEAWGLVSLGVWNSPPIEAGLLGRTGAAHLRNQNLIIKRPAEAESNPIGALRLREEIHESADLAERRAQDLGKVPAIDHRPRRRSSPSEGFAFENRVYWISGRDENSREEIRRILGLLRSYCENTPTREVRFYE
jgi:hypothetical protein